MSRKNNFPNVQNPQVESGEIASMVRSYEYLWELPPIHKGEVEQTRDRITDYFKFCQLADRKPSVEALSLALGVSRQMVWRWEHSDDDQGKLIARAKALINTMLTDMSMNGNISPVVAIWLQKNHYGYTDTVTIDTSQHKDDRPTRTATEIASKYAEVLQLPEEEKPKL